MKQLRRLRPTPAMVVACIALTVALGGTSVAAINALPRNSVGAKQLKKNAVTNPKIKANAVNGAKVANDSITGADVNEGSLGTVPSATNATNATNAATATTATNATNATSAGVANAAYSTFRDPLEFLPAGAGQHVFITLNVPAAGLYVVFAKFSLVNDAAAETEYRCLMTAESDADAVYTSEGEDAGNDDSRAVAMSLVHQFAAAGSVTVSCNNPEGNATSVRVADRKVTAIQVRALTNTPATGPARPGHGDRATDAR